MVVKARVNNHDEEMEFIFDTGAFDNKISVEAANMLGLKIVTSKDNLKIYPGIYKYPAELSNSTFNIGNIK